MMLLGVVWQDHLPHLRVRSAPKTASELVPVAGQLLRYRLKAEPERTCIGHVPFRSGRGDYVDCDNAPQPSSRVCERCAIVEATFASNLHHAHTRGSAELDPAIQKHMEQPNRLYLAAFRDGSIKVGTSTLARSQKRLEEQGAWQARFVAETTNGRVVRHIEDAITEQLGLPQSVSATRKLRGLVNPVEDTKVSASLDDMAAVVERDVVARELASSVTSLNEPWRHPMADNPDVHRAIEYPLRLQRGRHDLELVTAVGRHLIARRPDGDDVFVIDPMPLYGIWLEVGDFGSDEIAIQDSLF